VNLLELLRAQIVSVGEKNRRQASRRRRVTLLTVQPLDGDLALVGEPIWAMSQDISENGMGFICQHNLMQDFVQITVVEDNVTQFGVVRHSRIFDQPSGKFFIGVEFMDDDVRHQRSRR